MQIVKNELQERIRAIAKGETLKQISRNCGLSENALYQSDNLTGNALLKLAEYLDCSVDYILGRTSYMNGDECERMIDKIIEGESLRELEREYGGDFAAHYATYYDFARKLAAEEGKSFAARA